MASEGEAPGETSPEPVGQSVDQSVKDLMDQWKETKDESQRAKVRQELVEAVHKQFAFRLSLQEEEVSRLEAKVRQIRQQLEHRRQKEEEIVSFRVEQLLREAQGLGWGTEPGTPGGEPIQPSQSGMAPVVPTQQ